MSIARLIHLEKLKCNNKRNSIIALGVCVLVFIMSLCTFFPSDEWSGEYNNFYCIINYTQVYNKMAWTLFASVLFSILFSEEYVSRSINVLFTYPVSRMKICFAKYIYIFGVTFIGYVVSTVIFIAIFILMDSSMNLISSPVLYDEFPLIAGIIVFNGIYIFCVTCIAFLINVYSKSSKATIVISVILGILLYQNVSSTEFFGKSNYVDIIFCITGIICSLIAIRKLVVSDVQ